MKKLWTILRPVFLFATVWGALLLGNTLCFTLATKGYNLPPLFSACVSLFLTLLLAYSLSRLLVLFLPRDRLYEGHKTQAERLRFLWASPVLRLALPLFALLPLPYPAFTPILGALSPFLRYLAARLYLLPLLVAFLIGALRGLVFTSRTPRKRGPPRFSFSFCTRQNTFSFIRWARFFCFC